MTSKITKAVFPVAGLGTRFLPATKASPKEMLPIVDKPLIQYAVEEAVAAGITDLIFITGAEGGPPSNIARGSDKLVYQGKLYTLAINCRTGKIVWRREAPRNRVTQYQTNNSPATPSAVTDDQSVYVLFQDFGLLAYTKDGAERWRLPLGPFTNENGSGLLPFCTGTWWF
jgi:outer membrane protein assembly factor BamB